MRQSHVIDSTRAGLTQMSQCVYALQGCASQVGNQHLVTDFNVDTKSEKRIKMQASA